MKIINRLFATLGDWRHLPNYQLERRADIFFALYLDKILQDALKIEAKNILPELPIRNATVNTNLTGNRSFKVDYAVFDDNYCYLVELKTDDESLNYNQVDKYTKTIQRGFQSIVDGILTIAKTTKEKHKYKYLINRLNTIGALKEEGPNEQYTFYPQPIIIKPTGKDHEKYKVINFDTIINCLEKETDELAQAFARALAQWREPA